MVSAAHRRRCVLLVVTVLALFKLGHHQSLAESTNETSPAPPASTPSSHGSIYEDHIAWLLSLINGADFDDAEYERRFSPVFVAQVSADQFLAALDRVRPLGESWSVIGVDAVPPPPEEEDDGAAADSPVVVRIAPAAGEPVLVMSFRVDEEGRMYGLLIVPAEAPKLDDPPETVEEAVDRLVGSGHDFGYLVADVDEGGSACTPLSGLAEDRPAPIGSMFKLYVLGAVVDAVHEGVIAWDQSVEVVDEYRSLPSGIVQYDPPGATRTVRELSELMISISDNTATDHLMGLVGRSAVEGAVRDYGHSAPELNEPFLFTRELFLLKLGGRESSDGPMPGTVGRAYLELDDVEERREFLSGMRNETANGLDIVTWTQPIAVDELEWFASPLDLCNVLALLRRNEEAARILAINPGIPDTEGLWSYIGFKGGSEPGVLGLAWYLEADGGIRRVVTGTVWDPDRVIVDQGVVLLLLGAVRDLSLKNKTMAPTPATTPVDDIGNETTTTTTKPASGSNEGADETSSPTPPRTGNESEEADPSTKAATPSSGGATLREGLHLVITWVGLLTLCSVFPSRL